MNMSKYEPWKFFDELHKDINALFHHKSNQLPSEQKSELATFDWSPKVDVEETKSAYVIKAEIPGVDPDNIQLTIENGVLTLKGEKQDKKESEKDGIKRTECQYGNFMRSFSLPSNVSDSEIEAHSDHGVLTITLPKSASEESQTRIPIQKK